MARKAIYLHATQVNTSTYPDDGSSPVGSSEWNADPDPQGMIGCTPATATITIASGVATITDSVSVIAAESSTSDILDKVAITNTNQYDLVYLFADTGDTITLTNTSSPSADGHVKTITGADETLSTTVPTILMRKGAYWYGYGGGVVADLGITTAKLAADAVTAAKLADDVVDSEHLAAGGIDTEHLGALQVTTAKIAADAIDGTKLADDAVDSEHYTDGSIDNAHIADDAIDSEHYADGSIDNAHIADDAIDSEHYADASIDLAHLASDSVDGSKIADNAIDSEHYTDASIDLAHLAGDSVDGSKIVDDAIDSEHYAAGSIDTAHIAASQVTLAKLANAAKTQALMFAVSDESTALTTGTAKLTFRMPYAMTLNAGVLGIKASLTTAGSTSGVTTIDVNESGSTILSTKLTIDSGETTSVSAATAPVISDTALAADAVITVDIDGLSGGASEAGLKITLIGIPA